MRDKKYEKCNVIRPNFHIFTDNLLVKSIFKTYKNIDFKNSHSPTANNLFKCDINGNKNGKILPNNNIEIESNLTDPYIKHYQCKTVEEFFFKLLRGDVY